jgi:hypothetical protein
MTNTATKLALSALMIGASGMALSGTANAAKLCKPSVTAKGMYYTTLKNAKSSARYRWGLKAASKYGTSWAHFGKAKNPHYSCTGGHGPKGKNFNCRVTARPCRTLSLCKGTVKAKGVFYSKRKKAEKSAKYRWSLAAAEKFGVHYAHWNKARSKRMTCTFRVRDDGKGPFYRCRALARACR